MKKVLGICEKPSISVYAHHGYINAIMQNEEHTNDVLYSLLIQNFENQNWTFDGEDTKLCIKSSHQIIKSKKYSRNNEAFLIRNCNAVDEICVEIEKWTFTQGDSVFNVILTDDNYRKCCKEDYNIIRIGIVKNSGLYYKVDGKYRKVPSLSAKEIKTIRLIKNINKLKIYVVLDDGKTLEIVNEIIDSQIKVSKIGINVNAGENQYYNWLFMNYMQTYYTEEDKVVCYDYYDLPERNFSHHILNHFLLYRDETIRTIEVLWKNVLNFCKMNIQSGRYIQIMLNEFYIPNRAFYNKENYFHANLLYGID